MNGFHRRTEEKKAVILEVALGELKAGSFGLTPIKEIAGAAKVSQVSIYNYFGSKDELLLAAMISVLDDKLAKYNELLQNEGEFTRFIAVLMKEETEIVRFVQACLRQSADASTLQSKVEAYQGDMLIPFLLELMERGKREGFIAADLKESELLVYFGMYQREWSRLMGAAEGSEGASLTAAISEERFIRFFFKGLMG